MKFYFHPDAEVEFYKAIEYYEQFQPGLGFEFAEEVYAAITRIIQYPDAWSALTWSVPIRSDLSGQVSLSTHYCSRPS